MGTHKFLEQCCGGRGFHSMHYASRYEFVELLVWMSSLHLAQSSSRVVLGCKKIILFK